MTTPMISLLPRGEWSEATAHADGLALNLTLHDRDPETSKLLAHTHLSFHYTGNAAGSQSEKKDAEAQGRDRLASLFVAAAGALFETATPAVQRRMGALIRDADIEAHSKV